MLGAAGAGSDTAMKALSFIGQQTLVVPDGPSLQNRFELAEQISPVETSNTVLAFPTTVVVALFNRPWRQRISIFQEFLLAKNVKLICGNIDMPFSLLSLAFCMLYELPMLSASGGGALESRFAALTPIFNCKPRLLQAAARGNGQYRQPLIERLDGVHSL